MSLSSIKRNRKAKVKKKNLRRAEQREVEQRNKKQRAFEKMAAEWKKEKLCGQKHSYSVTID